MLPSLRKVSEVSLINDELAINHFLVPPQPNPNAWKDFLSIPGIDQTMQRFAELTQQLKSTNDEDKRMRILLKYTGGLKGLPDGIRMELEKQL